MSLTLGSQDKLVPTEVYPLISAVTVVSGFAFYSMGASLKHEGHNVRAAHSAPHLRHTLT